MTVEIYRNSALVTWSPAGLADTEAQTRTARRIDDVSSRQAETHWYGPTDFRAHDVFFGHSGAAAPAAGSVMSSSVAPNTLPPLLA
jgi:hypothetical protein